MLAAVLVVVGGSSSSSQGVKEELLKLGGFIKLLVLVEDAATDSEAAYAAVGCLASLAAHPRCLQDMAAAAPLTARVVSSCLGLLTGGHDRSKLPASQVLLLMAQQPQLVPRLAAAQPALLEPSEYEPEPIKQLTVAVERIVLGVTRVEALSDSWEVPQARRHACLSSGVVMALLDQLLGAATPLLLSAAACVRFIALAPAAADILA
eukprot:gene1543-1882_t